MPHFRKKPVEAFRYTGNIMPMGSFFDPHKMAEYVDNKGPYLQIMEDGNWAIVAVGNWVVKEPDGLYSVYTAEKFIDLFDEIPIINSK